MSGASTNLKRGDEMTQNSNFLLSFAIALFSFMVFPQDSVAQGDGTLEEIIVTAQRRAEGLGDVPLSISATTGETLERFAITRFDDLQSIIPNLHINEGVASPTITIRGFGSGAANFGFEQSVGMFVDGVYIGRSRLLVAPLFDIERVEVVRGTQGALFGKNTVAGAVSITTAKPTDEFEAQVRTGYEFEYGGSEFESVFSGPFSDSVSGRIAARVSSAGGYMNNGVSGAEEPERDSFVLRGSLAFSPTDRLNGALKLEMSEVNVDGSLYQVSVAGPLGALSPPNEFVLDDRRFPEGIEDEFEDTETSNVTLSIGWDVGEHTVTSITSYAEVSFAKIVELAATIPTFTTNAISEDFDQVTQEFRVLSPTGGSFEYSFGAIYIENDMKTHQLFTLRPRILRVPRVAPFDGWTDRNFEQKSKSWSPYFSGTWHATDSFNITAGLRYTDESKSGRAYHTAAPQNPASPPPEVPGNWFPYDIRDERDEEKVTSSLNAQYHFTGETMAYASFSQGHKGGGFVSNESTLGWQIANAAPGENPFQYEDETADSIEVGAKTRFLGGRASLNTAFFQTDFENLQVSTFNGAGFDTDNAAEVRSEGIEFDLTVLLSDIATLGISWAHLDSKYSDYPDALRCGPSDSDPDCQPGGDGMKDLTGKTLIRSPDWEGSLFLDLSMPVGDSLIASANLLVTYKDKFYHQPDLDELDAQDAATKLNARFALGNSDGVWDVAIVGRNLTNEKVKNWSFDTPFAPGAHSASIEPLRTIMLEGTYRF